LQLASSLLYSERLTVCDPAVYLFLVRRTGPTWEPTFLQAMHTVSDTGCK